MYRRHGCPLDPDRNERQGWLGDIGANTESDFFNWDAISFFKKWLMDIQLDQKPSGQLPDISPAIWPFYSKNIDWPAAYLIIVWNIWKFTGDRSLLERHFPSLVAWIGFIEKELVLDDGTVNENVYTDWCDTSTIGKSDHFSTITSGPFISSAYWTYCAERVARIAAILDFSQAGQLQEKAEWARTGFLKRFVDPATGASPNNSQCELGMLLAMDLVPQDLKDPVSRLLHEAVCVHADGHPTVGLVGMQWLMQGLLAGNCHEAAWRLLTCKTRPSWGYMIEQGATTFWENWDTDSRDPGMNSEALLMLAGNLNSYLYEGIGGIHQQAGTTGFRQLLLAPLPIGELTEAEVSFSPPQGCIRSHWRIESECFHWEIEIPPHTSASVELPEGYALASCLDAAQSTNKGSVLKVLQKEEVMVFPV
jgi:alpha-L-rhamnosidase